MKMKKILQLTGCLFLFSGALAQPISLNPVNPHYFLFRGKALTIISSSEHYGAVLNPAFDYLLYLNTLQKEGMNYTRLFTGSYFEKEGSFGIEHNNLAPAPGQALIPWKRSQISGALCGGNKFDMDKWDDNYFTRLKSFVSEAGKRGIIVEITLFSSIYSYWDIQVWNPANNINIKENLLQSEAQILKNQNVWKYQESFVRKIVRDLNEFDNITYEIQNEPWCDHTVTLKNEDLKNDFYRNGTQEWQKKVEIADKSSLDWQKKIAAVIVNEENKLRNKHLIAQNYCNHFWAVPDVDPNVSILNFHYAYPVVIKQNSGYNRVTGFDESGFDGSADSTYRKEAWRFIMSGGGLFNNLDYSFYAGYENGTGGNEAPGGGSTDLRKELKVLSDFIHSFNFVRMNPDESAISDIHDASIYILSEPGRQYAVYLEKGTDPNFKLKLNLPAGNYQCTWINALNGNNLRTERLNHKGGVVTLTSPDCSEDTALKITL
jgi:hypothetical protein